MTNITENVEKLYKLITEAHNQKFVEPTLPRRLLNGLKFTGLVAMTYGAMISLPKLFPGTFQAEQYANMNYVEYMKQSAEFYVYTLPVLFSIGVVQHEISKVIHGMVYQPIILGSKGIDYVSARLKL